MHRAGEEAGRGSAQVKNKENFLNSMANGTPESGGQLLTISREETSFGLLDPCISHPPLRRTLSLTGVYRGPKDRYPHWKTLHNIWVRLNVLRIYLTMVWINE